MTAANTKMEFETLAVIRPAPFVIQLAFNRPAAMNAINTQTGRDLLAFLHAVKEEAVRAIILTGTGPRAFSAGGDLKERHGMSDAAWLAQHALFEDVTFRLLECAVPVIAAVNGVAFGGGCELALCCDFIYAAASARFALTETRLGIMPGGGGTQNLPRAVGMRRAKELIFSATPFSAEQAERWGMVNRVCPDETLLADTLELAGRIAANAPLSVIQAKKSINAGAGTDLRTALLIEIEAYNRLVLSQDRHEGVRAFNEKRPADFKGV
jgi:enoyl-CoA hydratase/carnithine racemase